MSAREVSGTLGELLGESCSGTIESLAAGSSPLHISQVHMCLPVAFASALGPTMPLPQTASHFFNRHRQPL